MHLNFTTTRRRMRLLMRRVHWLRGALLSEIAAYDLAAPGWRQVSYVEIHGLDTGVRDMPDIVACLPRRVFLRGWDATGVIKRAELQPSIAGASRVIRRLNLAHQLFRGPRRIQPPGHHDADRQTAFRFQLAV